MYITSSELADFKGVNVNTIDNTLLKKTLMFLDSILYIEIEGSYSKIYPLNTKLRVTTTSNVLTCNITTPKNYFKWTNIKINNKSYFVTGSTCTSNITTFVLQEAITIANGTYTAFVNQKYNLPYIENLSLDLDNNEVFKDLPDFYLEIVNYQYDFMLNNTDILNNDDIKSEGVNADNYSITYSDTDKSLTKKIAPDALYLLQLNNLFAPQTLL